MNKSPSPTTTPNKLEKPPVPVRRRVINTIDFNTQNNDNEKLFLPGQINGTIENSKETQVIKKIGEKIKRKFYFKSISFNSLDNSLFNSRK